MSKSILKELKQLNKQKGGIFENLIYRNFSVYITSVLVHTKLTPSLITTFAMFFAFIAAFFYFRGDYVSLIIGTILLNLSAVLDCVDGELARYKKLGSQFGGWWDSTCDRIVEYVVFSSLILGLYFKTTNPTVLILALFALPNLVTISNIRSLNRMYFDPKPNHEFRFGKNLYLGGTDTFVVLVSITALLNQVYYLLLIYAILGGLIWIRQIYRRFIIENKSKS